MTLFSRTCYACVARGSWHGDVAIRVVQMDPDLDNQVQLQKFKQEVSEAVSRIHVISTIATLFRLVQLTYMYTGHGREQCSSAMFARGVYTYAICCQVAMLRKVRHENLVLFMGACMKPPNLAIVTK